jgi:putative toxin-antitoxin system antitoxin component (TIGR02293 family)
VRGEEVFGEMNLFKEWMNRNLRALGNKKPKEFLDTSIGIHFIMDELGRIEHGVFA